MNVSWFEAAAFAAWLSALGVDRIGLPDEVTWEHACRAGTTTAYWSGNDEAALHAVGWYQDASGGRTHAVGDLPSKRAAEHPHRIRHLHGNVREWTSSWKTPDHSMLPNDHDPSAPSDRPPAARRVFRGGTWWFAPRICRAAFRGSWSPTFREVYLGFRLVRWCSRTWSVRPA